MPSDRESSKEIVDTSSNSERMKELNQLFRNILTKGIYGISFSAYLENQAPGSPLQEDQIQARMDTIKPYISWVRSFSCIEGNEFIPRIAHENGLKTVVGAWLGTDAEKNEREVEGVIEVAQAGHADIVAVGNEVLLRGDLTMNHILDFILRVRKEISGIPVGYVDAYSEFSDHPALADACDVILANCYPFWEGYPIEDSVHQLKEMYRRAKEAGKGKKVIISETGWPNIGSAQKAAVPSHENALTYFIDTYSWAEKEDIDVIYFSSFDEAWKQDVEGDVGAFWGLWDKDGHLKYG